MNPVLLYSIDLALICIIALIVCAIAAKVKIIFKKLFLASLWIILAHLIAEYIMPLIKYF
jgi:hypothetical protein